MSFSRLLSAGCLAVLSMIGTQMPWFACVPAIASDHSAVSELIKARENLSHKTIEEIFSKPVVCDPLPDYSSRDTSIATAMARDGDLSSDLRSLRKFEPGIAWIAWHKRVFNAIQVRLANSGRLRFRCKTPLSCTVSCIVGRNFDISNCHQVKRSGNAAFDTMVLNALKSINRSKDLLFPAGTHSEVVETTGTFILNPSVNSGRLAVSEKWELGWIQMSDHPFDPSMRLPEKQEIDWVNFDKLRLVR
jgi:hypothetical protein